MAAMPFNGDDEVYEAEVVNITPIEKLGKELRQLGSEIDRTQARGYVDLYYRWQEHRIALAGQRRAALQGADPGTSTELLDHFIRQVTGLEAQIKGVLQTWAGSHRVGEWSMNQYGIGPIIAAGLLAHIDITRAQTAGAIWRFGGYDPNQDWHSREKADQAVKSLSSSPTYEEVGVLARQMDRKPEQVWEFASHDAKGNERNVTKATVAAALARRPHNAKLKVLFFKIGDSFLKTSNRPQSFYGKIYRERKIFEVERNLAGGNAEAAAKSLATRNIRDADLKATLEAGRLPAGQLERRAQRYAVKLFLSHWHEVAYRDHFKTDPPAPYVIAHGGHTHYIPVPPG